MALAGKMGVPLRDQAKAEHQIMVSDLIRSCGPLPAILPSSRHRPRASTDGSLTKNLNKTGVRLWTAPPFSQHREIGGRHPLDSLADAADRLARPDQRRRAVARVMRRRRKPDPANGAFELQHHGRQLRRGV